MLTQMLARTVDAFPDNPAIIYGDFRLDYRGLGNLVSNVADGMSALGCRMGNGIALVLPNCPVLVASFYAVARLGMTIQLLNPLLSPRELETNLRDHPGLSMVVTNSAGADTCRQALAQLDREVALAVFEDTRQAGFSVIDPVGSVQALNGGDILKPGFRAGNFIYQTSSGSTGLPKMLGRTQGNLVNQAMNCTATMQISPVDSILAVIPMHHAYGLGECLLSATATGAALVILESDFSPGLLYREPLVFRTRQVLELIEREKITVLPLVPYVASMLVGAPAEQAADLSSLRLCVSAASFLSENVIGGWAARFGIRIKQLYGCTESGTVAIDLGNDPESHNCIGTPIKNVILKVVDEAVREVTDGASGELLVISESLAKGYLNHPEANLASFVGGGFLTGDLARKDARGKFHLLGRKRKSRVIANLDGKRRVQPMLETVGPVR